MILYYKFYKRKKTCLAYKSSEYKESITNSKNTSKKYGTFPIHTCLKQD